MTGKSNQLRKLDFIVAGTQKGGTSALDFYLRQHPQIGMGKKKELHFFDKEKYFRKKGVPYRKLHKEIIKGPETIVYGESTPVYMYWQNAMKRIKDYNPDIRILIILRNPIERAFSHWNMEIQKGKENEDFLYALENEEERCRESLPLPHRVYSYTDRSRYAVQLENIFSLFPKKQLMIIKFEEFVKHQEDILNHIFQWLGVDPSLASFSREDIHKREYHREMTKEERKFLQETLRNDIKKTSELLEWDCSDWI